MNTIASRFIVLLLSLVCVSFAADEHDHAHDHDHDHAKDQAQPQGDGDGHAGHGHGGAPPEEMTFTSLALTASGGVLVSMAMLAILWKPIDGAFRRSRYRARWEQRNFRITFAVIVTVVVAGGLGGMAFMNLERKQHQQIEKLMDALRPMNGGVVREAGRFAIEMVARRTGEVRVYMRVLSGDAITRWDVKGSLVVSTGAGAEKQEVPLKIIPSGEYMVGIANLYQTRNARIHLSLKVKDEPFEVDFDVPVQD